MLFSGLHTSGFPPHHGPRWPDTAWSVDPLDQDPSHPCTAAAAMTRAAQVLSAKEPNKSAPIPAMSPTLSPTLSSAQRSTTSPSWHGRTPMEQPRTPRAILCPTTKRRKRSWESNFFTDLIWPHHLIACVVELLVAKQFEHDEHVWKTLLKDAALATPANCQSEESDIILYKLTSCRAHVGNAMTSRRLFDVIGKGPRWLQGCWDHPHRGQPRPGHWRRIMEQWRQWQQWCKYCNVDPWWSHFDSPHFQTESTTGHGMPCKLASHGAIECKITAMNASGANYSKSTNHSWNCCLQVVAGWELPEVILWTHLAWTE